jgi:hypothetical protein
VLCVLACDSRDEEARPIPQRLLRFSRAGRGSARSGNNSVLAGTMVDHTAAGRTELRATYPNSPNEEVRLGVTDGEPHELWQLPVDLEWGPQSRS